MKTRPTSPNEDILAIREIMERSSKFLSINGLAGVLAGIVALVGAAFSWLIILGAGRTTYGDLLQNVGDPAVAAAWMGLALIAAIVLVFAVTGAVFFSHRKARKAGQKLWTVSTRNLLVHFLIPLASGGIFVLILVFGNYLGLVPSAMLIFYGLSLVNAGKFTFGEIHSLGLTVIALGILAGFFPSYGLLFWAMGFGLMHIIYGSIMYHLREKKGR